MRLGIQVQHRRGRTAVASLSQCLLLGGGVVGVGVLVKRGQQGLQGRLRGGGRRLLLQGAKMCGGVWGGGAVAGVGGAPAQCGGGRGGEATQARRGVDEGLVVEEERALVDEGLDDCLVGARGGQGVHGGEVGPHEGGPETDGQVIAGHQVHPAQLAHPENKNTHRASQQRSHPSVLLRV